MLKAKLWEIEEAKGTQSLKIKGDYHVAGLSFHPFLRPPPLQARDVRTNHTSTDPDTVR